MNRVLALLPLFFLLACSRPNDLVRPDRLAPGGEKGGGGGVGVFTRPDLDILVHMQHDSTDFDANLLMQLIVDGANRAEDMVIGGVVPAGALDVPLTVGELEVIPLQLLVGNIDRVELWNPARFPSLALDFRLIP